MNNTAAFLFNHAALFYFLRKINPASGGKLSSIE